MAVAENHDPATGQLDLIRLADRQAFRVTAEDPARLAELLGSDRLTRFHGHPLVIAIPEAGVLAVALGPAEPPPQIDIIWGAYDLEGD